MGPRGVLAGTGAGEGGYCPSPLCSSHTGFLQALALPLLFLFNLTHLLASEDEPPPPWTSPQLPSSTAMPAPSASSPASQLRCRMELNTFCAVVAVVRMIPGKREFRADGSTCRTQQSNRRAFSCSALLGLKHGFLTAKPSCLSQPLHVA